MLVFFKTWIETKFRINIAWLVGCFGFNGPVRSISVYIGPINIAGHPTNPKSLKGGNNKSSME